MPPRSLPFPRRLFSTGPPPPPRPPPSPLQRIQSRLPPRLRPYLTPLLSAPLSHITSFLLLHELTAILPLAALFGLFHYSSQPWTERWRANLESSEAFQEGAKRWGRYAARKGWVEADQGGEGGREVYEGGNEGAVTQGIEQRGNELQLKARLTEDGRSQAPTIVLELAAAWAVTKVLLPARLAVSVWATPWFARVAVVPVTTLARRIVRR